MCCDTVTTPRARLQETHHFTNQTIAFKIVKNQITLVTVSDTGRHIYVYLFADI